MSFCPLPSAPADLTTLAKGSTLLLPAVSTGNVPQLSVDLLLASLPHTLLGSFYSQHVQPCVGGDALAVAAVAPSRKTKGAAIATPAASLTTALQLWSIPSLNLLVLQQRAPTLRGRHRAFVSELLAWARPLQLRQVILLTASLAFRRGDEELDAEHPVSFFHVAGGATPSEQSDATATLLRDTLHFNPLQSGGIARGALEQDDQPFRFEQLNSAEGDNADDDDPMRVGGARGSQQQQQASQRETAGAPLPRIPVPGLGITRPLFEAVTAAAAVAAPAATAAASSGAEAALPSTLFLSCFVNEGANDRDAMELCHHLYTLLFLQLQQSPSSSSADKQEQQQAKPTLQHPQNMVWTTPTSWDTFFGNREAENLYL